MKTRTNNPESQTLIKLFNKQAKVNKVKIWKSLVDYLSKSKRSNIVVNIEKLVRFSSDGDIIAVPGKVLGSGLLTHKLSVAAFNFTPVARTKIEAAGGKCVDFYELINKNPKGSNIKIIR